MTTVRPIDPNELNEKHSPPSRLPIRWLLIVLLVATICIVVHLAGAPVVAVVMSGCAVATAAHRLIE
ncbi:hypothetical protein [Nocardia sp. 348MFTsu5.1]|uniref:hypothetical protein n=1 Tax=Nocardia sp. 348MFTsu5.1 TaxID=1172185 RepID=UPI00035D700B|nr:hypothetical protein [Nocardia sp. 348MFTsu5.1]